MPALELGVFVCRALGRRLGAVEKRKTTFDFAEVAVVECVGMDLHEKSQGVQGKENLGGPGPAQHERPVDPEYQPPSFKQALEDYPTSPPPKKPTSPEQLLQRQDEHTADHHGQITQP